MKLIDKQGKVFGKINLIDLLLILVMIAGIAFVGLRYFKTSDLLVSREKVMISFYADETPKFVVDNVKIGDKVTDDTGNVDLGVITDIQVGPSESWGVNADGEYVRSSKDTMASAVITAEADGQMFEHGAIIGGNKYTSGHSLVIRAGHGKFYLKVYDVQPVE